MSITNLREQLLRDEGTRLKPYRDQVGKLTIGTGRNLDDVGISLQEAEMMLETDITRARAAVLAHLPWTVRLDEVRRDALVNIAFNCGIAGLLGFQKALAAMEAGDYAAAAAHFYDSKWRKQVGPRADRLCAQITDGEWH